MYRPLPQEPEVTATQKPNLDDVLAQVKDRLLGDYKDHKVMYKEGQLESGGKQVCVGRVLLDNGASSRNYIGQALVDRFPYLELEPCPPRVRLGDNKTEVHITRYATLEVALYDEKSELTDSIFTESYVMPNLGDEIIIGLPDILGNYYDYFIGVLENARRKQCKVERLYALHGLARKESSKYKPSPAKLKRYVYSMPPKPRRSAPGMSGTGNG